ncbi:copper-transporting ATPase PAA1, chloroplastic isoform X2 [Manihot esculenta]|uniref:copper-transporting ATPase PAA1, chloroplastic isoform X2 n=1 Tax=Manihot esculenta TaxID=3983 RepID=UPI000B5D41AD|nr:copper-transporting ATPase PAA1, chloroplastic isoform X2 [Manihot esculenta]
MESAFSLSTSSLALFTISRALNRHFNTNSSSLLRTRCLTSFYTRNSFPSSSSSSSSSSSFRTSCAPLPRPLYCVSNTSSSFTTSGGGNDSGGPFGGSGGGGGGDRSDGSDAKSNLTAGGTEDVSALSPDVIILDVGGMTCGGCAASVKRILESQPQVSSASVNLTTETAIVWPLSEAKVVPNWKKQLGEELAKQLTSCGFKSNLRDAGRGIFFSVFEKKMEEKRDRLRESGRELAVSWALCAVCLFGHLSHIFALKASWIHMFHSTGFHLSLSLFTLLGPGRQLILDGVKSLLKGAPNMNTLVGLGALSSFAVSSLAALIPKLGWKAFFEEPIMLIAFVLLGRNLEQRAKIKATSDMTGLLSILPSKARLLIHDDAKDRGSIVEVPCTSLSVGDQIFVLPGDRVPADGIVRAGRSTIDESSFTGEPLPVTKLPGSQVAAGSINLNGTLTVEVQRPGGETAIGDIVRLVEEAQSREAPVQRLADKVSGHFTYGVMALSAATFMFWNLFGTHVLPAAFHHGNPVSLALQLSCSVLVIACPCALGLATPTAVLVGTSLGATRGLLLRGGSVLEKFSMAKTIVFDKTGTLTIGRPVVTKVVTPGGVKITDIQENVNLTLSEVEVLKLAAGVESNTIHPVGKAIVEAAQAAGCQNVKVKDGTFMEEPGSGAVATIENKKVSVGTLDWVQRNGVYDNPFQEVEDLKNQSIVFVGVDNTLAGLIYLEDQIREDARYVVESLSRQGINVWMLSGDRRNTAEYVASIVGIPKDKLLDALELSRLTMKTVKQNLWWAFAYNIIGIPIAAGMLLPVTGTMLTPSIAGALMGLSSIGVMSNSLLLRLKFSSKQKQAYGAPTGTKILLGSDILMDQREKMNQSYSGTQWREAR